MSERPVDGGRETIAGPRRHRPGDELRLPAVAMWGHHQAARHLIRDLRAVIEAHEVETQVDPRGAAGRAEHVAVVHVQRVGLDADARVLAAQPLDVTPVGGGPPAVQQPGRGEDEHPRADRHHACPAPMGAAQRTQQPRRRGFGGIAPARNDHRVGPRDGPQAAGGREADRAGRAQRPAVERAHREFVPGDLELGTRQAKDLDRDRELEQREAIVDHRDDAMAPVMPARASASGVEARHGVIIANNVISA